MKTIKFVAVSVLYIIVAAPIFLALRYVLGNTGADMFLVAWNCFFAFLAGLAHPQIVIFYRLWVMRLLLLMGMGALAIIANEHLGCSFFWAWALAIIGMADFFLAGLVWRGPETERIVQLLGPQP